MQKCLKFAVSHLSLVNEQERYDYLRSIQLLIDFGALSKKELEGEVSHCGSYKL